MQNFSYGCRIEPRDERDFDYAVIAGASPAVLPNSFVVKPKWTWNQGNIDSCVGHAVALAKSEQEGKELSPRHAWSHGKKRDGYIGWGTSIANVLKGVCSEEGLVSRGTIDESNKLDRDTYMRVSLTVDQQQEATQNRGKSYWGMWSWRQADEALMELKMPLITSMYWSDDYTPDNAGFIYPSENKQYGHAFVYCGWGHKNGKKYRIFKNSWGEQWGNKGYFYIWDADIHKFGIGGRYAIVDIELDRAKILANYQGQLIKKKGDYPKVYYVSKKNIVWINSEPLFHLGTEMGMWGTFGDVIEVEANIKEDYEFTFRSA